MEDSIWFQIWLVVFGYAILGFWMPLFGYNSIKEKIGLDYDYSYLDTEDDEDTS